MSCVKYAENKMTGVKCAVKIVRKEILNQVAGNEQKIQNLLSILEQTNSPHIVRINELLEDADKLYIVMEFVDQGDANLLRQFSQERLYTHGEVLNLVM